MAVDAEGYGYRPGEGGLERLLRDARVLSPAGIERAAWGWDRHEDPAAMQRFHDAERVALRALEQTDRGPAWEDARRGILDLTEGRTSLVSWKAEHGDLGHKAERALLGAALAQLTRDKLSHEQYVTLAQPMAEALPWLLPETPPEPRR
ncbi:MAG: hypothetical protein E6H90_07730 [Chloroflexi bacterium]|nr:MAG: hypothetical protein E6I46_02315 [Chloroflexota bacterium]TMF26367.1 MAG: hypothetical protein E6I31_00335 [Chloroflexota bacterium]TMG48233.1 MAG: hypothetical protein E6H90_07730 [Chloroflexota bacterium]